MSKAYPCIYCTDDLECTKYTDEKSTSFCVMGPCHDEKPSHADRIRAMTDEELAAWGYDVAGCPPGRGYPDCDTTWADQDGKCPSCWLDWLRQEAEECEPQS